MCGCKNMELLINAFKPSLVADYNASNHILSHPKISIHYTREEKNNILVGNIEASRIRETQH